MSKTSLRVHRTATVQMDTIVSVEVRTSEPEHVVRAALDQAVGWFAMAERVCSRFDADSELRRLTAAIGEPVPVSTLLFESVQFALTLARLTGGAFDPTVGHQLELKGFNRNYRTGRVVASPVERSTPVSFRDVRLSPVERTITLLRPLLLDLGAVAKGLAIDLAACELSAFEHVCIEAGGDLFVKGGGADGRPWRIGVQDPRDPCRLIYALEVSDQAVCTSGDYERRTADGGEHHLIDPRSGRSVSALASATVVAPTALAADGLATAAFVLGPDRGLKLLEAQGVGGALITPFGEILTTHELQGQRA